MGHPLLAELGEGFSRALSGRTHDLTSPSLRPGSASSPRPRRDPDLPDPTCLRPANRAYRGAGATVPTPYYGRDLPEQYTRFNTDHARLRAPGERAFARLK